MNHQQSRSTPLKVEEPLNGSKQVVKEIKVAGLEPVDSEPRQVGGDEVEQQFVVRTRERPVDYKASLGTWFRRADRKSKVVMGTTTSCRTTGTDRHLGSRAALSIQFQRERVGPAGDVVGLARLPPSRVLHKRDRDSVVQSLVAVGERGVHEREHTVAENEVSRLVRGLSL